MDESSETALPGAGHQQALLIPGAAGRLESLISMPKTSPPVGIAVVCHPHPLFGGAMSNKVVYSLATSLLKAGVATARFNFRGVGKSAGLYDESRGETDDALAVVSWMRERLPELPLTLAGFSFGAYVSLKAAATAKPVRLISVGIPFGKYVDSAVPPPHPGCAWLAVHSHDDEVVDFAATAAVLKSYRPPPQLVEFDGAGHFFHGRLTDLQGVVEGFLQAHA